MNHTLETASLSWQDNAVLRSETFGDIYYSDADGLAESRHVFIAGNDLTDRFAALGTDCESQNFTVAELGFGTGLNILALWKAWQQRGHNLGHLHIFSVEGFPLSLQSFRDAQQRISKRWTELRPLSKKLEDQYPTLTPGFHVLRLSEDTTLTLALGPVEQSLAMARLKANAWFLDGFSPAQNPEMWSEKVMMQVARLSAPQATFATFTVAGAVRRALEHSGFGLSKKPGFGRKREMLTGRLERPQPLAPTKQPWLSYKALSCPTGRRVLIAGAGIAGAAAAWHLRRAGFDVTVIDEHGPASGASGNPVGMVLPRLDLGDTPAARFYRDAWLYALRFISEVDEHNQILVSEGGIIASCNDESDSKHGRLAASGILPPDLLKTLESDQLRERGGIEGFLPCGTRHLEITKGGAINPKAFVTTLLQETQIAEARLVAINRRTAGEPIQVTISVKNKPVDLETDYIVLASAADAGRFLDEKHIQQSLGQIDLLHSPPPARPLTFGHYIAPLGNKCAIGATYEDVHTETVMAPTQSRLHQNLEAVENVLKRKLMATDLDESRTSCRAVTADRHPVVGALPDWSHMGDAYTGLSTGIRRDYAAILYQPGIFILSGLGSRGLTTAPYCAALLTSLMSESPCPMPKDQMDLIHPARFTIRNIKKLSH